MDVRYTASIFLRENVQHSYTENTLLEEYAVVIEIPVAWGEMDAVYFRYFENARIKYAEKIGLPAYGERQDRPDPRLDELQIETAAHLSGRDFGGGEDHKHRRRQNYDAVRGREPAAPEDRGSGGRRHRDVRLPRGKEDRNPGRDTPADHGSGTKGILTPDSCSRLIV